MWRPAKILYTSYNKTPTWHPHSSARGWKMRTLAYVSIIQSTEQNQRPLFAKKETANKQLFHHEIFLCRYCRSCRLFGLCQPDPLLGQGRPIGWPPWGTGASLLIWESCRRCEPLLTLSFFTPHTHSFSMLIKMLRVVSFNNRRKRRTSKETFASFPARRSPRLPLRPTTFLSERL